MGTKNPKKRFYRGSESTDYRVSAAVVQFNEGHEYMKAAEQKIYCVERETLNVTLPKGNRKWSNLQTENKKGALERGGENWTEKENTDKWTEQEGREQPTVQVKVPLVLFIKLIN